MYEWLQAADPMILIWLVLLVVFIAAELVTVGLISIWFAAGALVALILAALGAGSPIQIVVFFVVSVALLCVTRSFARDYINPRTQKTNLDSIVGEHIRIEERVSNTDQTGMAVVRGQEWTVRAADEKEIIESGEFAEVVAISGVKLMVKKISSEASGQE